MMMIQKTPPTPTVQTPMDGKLLIGEGTIDEASTTVKLYADEKPFVGYNKLYVMLYKTGTTTLIKNADVSFIPVMDMGHMTHQCPIEDPEITEPTNGIYEGAVVFIMESMGLGSWQLTVDVDNFDNDRSGEIAFEINVIRKEDSPLFSFIPDGESTPIFVSMVQPSEPKVGMNDFEITIHNRENKDSFPAKEDVTVS